MITSAIIKSNVLGLEAVTMRNGKPFFFLMADIDTHDREALLNVLKFFENRKLSCYTWATTKGYHVLSPCLLTFRHWSKLTSQLSVLVPSYRFDCLRMSRRDTDGKLCYFHQWNYRMKIESSTLHTLICRKLRVRNNDVDRYYHVNRLELVKPRETILKYTIYRQLSFTDKRPSVKKPKALRNLTLPIQLGFKSKEENKTLSAFDYSTLYEKEEVFNVD